MNKNGQPSFPPGSVYVKKWMRTKHAIMFRLSNKIVQVNFQDHTEILLNSENRYVTYVNKKGERSTMPLNQALDSNNAEMTKRLKYTKDILTHMLNNNQQQANPGPNPIEPGPMTTGATSNSSRRGLIPSQSGSNMNPISGFAMTNTNSVSSNQVPGLNTMSSMGQSSNNKRKISIGSR